MARRSACEHIGFFTVVNHGANASVVSAAWEDTRRFFDLDAASKEKWTSVNEAEYPYGYVGFGKEILSAGKVRAACFRPHPTAEPS